MNEQEKARALSRSLDAILRGEDTGAASDDDELRVLSALGHSLAEIEFEPGPVHKAAVERLLLEHRKQIKEAVTASEEVHMTPSQESPTRVRRPRSRWLVPLALSGGLAFLFVCVVIAVFGGSLAWRALRSDAPALLTPAAVAESGGGQEISPLPSATAVAESEGGQEISPLPSATTVPAADTSEEKRFEVLVPSVFCPLAPQHARLFGVHGLVRVQTEDGAWVPASGKELLQSGQRVRTGALSGAQLAFYDGSVAYLQAETEVSLDRLDQDADGESRIIELTQWVGETDHDVAPAYGGNARYEVHTPSGTGTAQGTFFHVSVTSALIVRFSVDEGAVEVTHVNVTVLVIAGQLTTIVVGAPPTEPVFRITGEGEVTEIGDTWTIAGQTFATHDSTVIVGNPQPGDWVRVDGHLQDGTRVADRIVLLFRSPTNRFTITGGVEATGAFTWTVAGQDIAVDDETDVEEGIESGDLVHVEGVIQEDGTLLAESIRLVAEPGLSFAFVGVVEDITETYWTVSGISVTVDADTAIDDGLAVGDVVRVRGVMEDDGTWLARSITGLLEPEYKFEFTGYVDTIEPWVVSGVGFETELWTEIDGDIEVGDLVKVEGRILADGTWVADEIELADDEDLSFEFVGTVDSIDPWVVSGIVLSVTGETEIEAGIVVSDLVKVEGEILPDGTWLATEIKLVQDKLGQGCVQIAALVLRVDLDLIVLKDGITLSLGPETVIEGQIRVDSVILLYLCVDAEGNATLVRIVVIYQLEPVIVIVPGPTPLPSDEEKVTICHKPGTPAEKTMTVPKSSLGGHLGHGDHLGPCTGNNDGDDDDDDD